MLKNSEQVRPLAAAAAADLPFISGEDQKTPSAAAKIRRIKCCGCAAALLVLVGIAAILASTVFRLRGPIVRVGNLTLGSFPMLSRRSNVTLIADVWVKNPNFASIDYGNMTTTLFYRGVAVGESRAPPGTARARRSERISATVVVMADRILAQPDLDADIVSGLVNVSSYTRVGGKINLAIFEKRVTVKMSCNVSINVTSREIQHHKCKRKIKL
ncbi:late embryogenesis abundant protein At1g64065-like [Salvia miltiorrhiza]|uniref:late embryogenesis abundant protein At1g64065-like n=1 Tax=Salvia miltiorrhiza TaxID=226208 RepID=UPI0025AD0D1D|nr:late embryogenesis abundant protein At1g64065-like [Salvia miltiorrhiza]